MKNNITQIMESIRLPKGIEVNITKAWLKLTTSQFGGNPERGFCELIQNAIDSYPGDVPIEDRQGSIEADGYNISIEDYGEGMDLARIELLITLGGTDKNLDPSKIGQFGMGFFSMFNPALKTQRVEVKTISDGVPVSIDFIVDDPKLPPSIEARLLEEQPRYSTRIEVTFGDMNSTYACLHYAEKSLDYYPCQMTINGRLYRSVWQGAKDTGVKIYRDGSKTGFLKRDPYYYCTTLLCKYEFLGKSNVCHFIKGGRNLHRDLRDFYDRDTPYLPGYSATINTNELRVTISRDNYYLDYQFDRVVSFLNAMYLPALAEEIPYIDTEVLLANQFIFRNAVSQYLKERSFAASISESLKSVITSLAEAKVYRLKDHPGQFSLLEIYDKKNSDLPLFYSSRQFNEDWLGGQFKHDFIVLPEECYAYNGAPNFYQTLFSRCFGESIDLDTVQQDPQVIKKLVEGNIIQRSQLAITCTFVGMTNLDEVQSNLLLQINTLLETAAIRETISENLRLPIRSIHAMFFTLRNDEMYLATGLFHEDGFPVSEDFITNFELEETEEDTPNGMPRDLILGLSIDHPLMKYIVASNNKFKAHYALTYIAGELTRCQKMLVPYSPFYHLTKEGLAADVRRVLIDQLIKAA